MKVKLTDGAPRSSAEVLINVSKNGNTLEVGVDGIVAPIVIEFYDGKVRLRVYGIDPSKPVFTRDLDVTVATLSTVDEVVSNAIDAIGHAVEPILTPSAVVVPAQVVCILTETFVEDDEMAAFDAA